VNVKLNFVAPKIQDIMGRENKNTSESCLVLAGGSFEEFSEGCK
jgi:hypothetical protein